MEERIHILVLPTNRWPRSDVGNTLRQQPTTQIRVHFARRACRYTTPFPATPDHCAIWDIVPEVKLVQNQRPQEERPMCPSFDIFKVDSTGQVEWQRACESVAVAKTSIQKLVLASPSDYLILDQTNGQRIIMPLSTSAQAGLES